MRPRPGDPFPRHPLAGSLALSLALHLLILFGQLPTFIDPQPHSPLPRFEVKMVELPPPAAAPARVKAPLPPPSRTLLTRPDSEARVTDPGKPADLPEPAEPAEKPVADSDPPLDAAERARIDRAYLPDASLQRKAQAITAAPTPDYPPEALRRGLAGCVLAVVYVGEGGQVDRVDILRSDHPGVFDQAVTQAQRGASYLPAAKNGRPAKSRILGVATFEIEGQAPLRCEQRYHALAQQLNAE